MRPIQTTLPAPTGGMLRAQRPTGIVMAFVVIFLALVAHSMPILVQAISQGITAALNGTVYSFTGPSFDNANASLTLFSFGLGILWLWFWVAVKERRSFATLGFESISRGIRLGGRGLLIGIIMMTICVLVPVLTGQATLQWASPDGTAFAFMAIMLLGFLVQGSTEEILTRGYLTQAVARRWGLLAGVIVQAIFFAALHGVNPGIGFMPIVNLLLFAVFASLMSLAEGSLWGVCALHGAWNWAQGNLFGVAVSGNPVEAAMLRYEANTGSADLLTGGTFGIEGSLVTTVVYLIGSYIAWKIWQKRRASDTATAAAATAATTTA